MQLIERGQTHEFRSEERLHHRGDLDHPRPQGLALQGPADRAPAIPWRARRWWRRGEGHPIACAAPRWAWPSGWAAGPITEPALPRLALSSWTAELGSGARSVRRRVMMTAFRNRTWIEWAVYAACQLRRLGVATTLVYSSSEVRRLYPLARVAGVDQLGFWAGVEEIPDVRLVDLDDWRPRPPRRRPTASFAREYAPTVAAYDLHVEENEEGPLGRCLSARGGARGGDAGRDRAPPSSGSCARTPSRASSATAASSAAAPPPARPRRRAGIEVLTVEGWAWRPGPHDLQPERAGPRVQPRGLAAGAGALGRGPRAGDDRASSASRKGRSGHDEAPPEPAPRAAHGYARRRCPRRWRRSAAVRARRFLLATNVVGDSSTLRRATALPEPARLAAADDRVLPGPSRLEPRRARPSRRGVPEEPRGRREWATSRASWPGTLRTSW